TLFQTYPEEAMTPILIERGLLFFTEASPVIHLHSRPRISTNISPRSTGLGAPANIPLRAFVPRQRPTKTFGVLWRALNDRGPVHRPLRRSSECNLRRTPGMFCR